MADAYNFIFFSNVRATRNLFGRYVAACGFFVTRVDETLRCSVCRAREKFYTKFMPRWQLFDVNAYRSEIYICGETKNKVK